MNSVSLGKKRLLHRIAASAALVLTLSLWLPVTASASTVLPTQILPPEAGKSCAAVTFSDIKPYIYDGSMDSFDITLSDASYVAVVTSVGDRAIPYNYITRWVNPDGSVRMHVDLQSTSVSSDIAIQIIFASVHQESNGTVTCLFNVPATVISKGESSSGGGQGTITPIRPSTPGKPTKPTPPPASSGTSTSNPGIVAASNSLGNLCADGGASRLWVVLLVLYAIFVFTLCSQRFDTTSRLKEWNIGLILAVFLGLLIFWYVSSVCRAGPWAPAFATLIAVAGLLYTMLKNSGPQEVLLLKDGDER